MLATYAQERGEPYKIVKTSVKKHTAKCYEMQFGKSDPTRT